MKHGVGFGTGCFPLSIYLGQALLVQTASVYLSHGPVALLIVLEVLPARFGECSHKGGQVRRLGLDKAERRAHEEEIRVVPCHG